MKQPNSFLIHNSTKSKMTIIHEPEAFEFELSPGNEVEIQTEADLKGLQLNMYVNDDSSISIQIWDNACPYKVVYNGEDVFREYLY